MLERLAIIANGIMSKLGDRIRKTLRPGAAPIGFHAVSRAREPSLLLAVLLNGADPKRTAAAVEQGADTVLLHLAKLGEGGLEAVVKGAADRPCGVWSGALDSEAASRLTAVGVDYLVFEAEDTLASVLLEEKAGYVLVLRGEHDDTYLRALDALPLDAVFLPDWRGPLTVHGQTELRRIAGLSRKPLMLPVPPSADGAELECLRDAGASLVLVDGDEAGAIEALPSLRQTIEALPAPRRRREGQLEALLPRPTEAAAAEEEEEDL